MGAQHRFEIWTDHKNLQYFRKPQKLNCHQAHELQEYNFLLVHKPGAQMKKADLLNRCAVTSSKTSLKEKMVQESR